jgi:simple sugar transport system ATP-binding protein
LTPAVQLKGIRRFFGSARALEDVDFQAQPGAIHAVVGENGAGKSTLMNILAGRLKPDAGQIEILGREASFQGPGRAPFDAIGMVSQHYSLIGGLSCWENVALSGPGPMILDPAAIRARAAELGARIGFAPDWNASAASLPPGAAQKLEIVKLLWRDARILILDEPTAMLSPQDSDALYSALASLAEQGRTVIVVTHRIAEVMAHASAVTALRAGRLVAAAETADLDAARLAEMIVGRAQEQARERRIWTGPPVLQLRAAAAGEGRGRLIHADLEVREGEMIGIAGVEGSGQAALFRLIQGLEPLRSGEASLFGRPMAGQDVQDRILSGLRVIPEDRIQEGLAPDWSLADNAILGLQRLEQHRRGPWIDQIGRRKTAEAALDLFQTRRFGLGQKAGALSGGNQQRLVAGRALSTQPKLLLAYQPTRGLDIEAIRQVYGEIRRACASGAAAIVVAYDLDELLERCPRVAAACAGRIEMPPPGKERSREAIGRMMVDAE